MKRVTPCRRRRVGGAEWDPGGAELSLRGVRDAATSAEIASAAPRNDNEGGSATGPAIGLEPLQLSYLLAETLRQLLGVALLLRIAPRRLVLVGFLLPREGPGPGHL